VRPLHVQDVVEMLHREIERVGSQSEWARQYGIDRTQLNRALNGRRLPPSRLCRALGLEWVIVRHPSGDAHSVIISKRHFLRMLRNEIAKAGGLTAWSRQIGTNRTYLSLVLHERKSPGEKILDALDLSRVLVCFDESLDTRKRRRKNGMRTKKGRK
jgi:DNA-binding phage protein